MRKTSAAVREQEQPKSRRGARRVTSTTPVVLVEGNVIVVRNFAARESEDQFRRIDLSNYWLPPTPFTIEPTRLADRIDLADAVKSTILGYGMRIGPENKSSQLQVANAIRSIVKFIEYGWLNGYYRLEDWTPGAATALAKRLGEGGWAVALNLEDRTAAYLSSHSRDEVAELITSSHTSSHGYSVANEFASRIGTNLAHQELTLAKQMMVAFLELTDRSKPEARVGRRFKARSDEAGMSQTQLRQEIAYINLLAERLDGVGLKFIPFPNTVKISREYGREGSSTANMTTETAAAVLKEAYWWIDKAAEPVVQLLEDVSDDMKAARALNAELTPEVVWDAINSSKHLGTIEDLLQMPIHSIGKSEVPDGMSFKQVIYCLVTACFVIIAFLNARRRDELVHRKIGLHRQALKMISAELGLYECEFYIEKTYRIYVPFYVGKLTYTAIRALERISDCARAVDEVRGLSDKPQDQRENKLFHLPRLVGTAAGGGGEQWYEFRAGKGGTSSLFLERALGKGVALILHPHMFRRAYALIFHYRYENATLQALARQLGHIDLQTAQIYISDRGVKEGAAAREFRRRTAAEVRAQNKAVSDLQDEVDKVAKERVRSLVEDVVAGNNMHGGGFARLVQRFHQRLGRQIDYGGLDPRHQAKVLSDALIRLGHAFFPMRHANCVASSKRRNRGAACFSKRLNRPTRENARSTMCTNCAYSQWQAGHRAAWEEDAVFFEEKIKAHGTQTLIGRKSTIELKNLRAILRLHRERVSAAEEEVLL